jgi:hypothetical protein
VATGPLQRVAPAHGHKRNAVESTAAFGLKAQVVVALVMPNSVQAVSLRKKQTPSMPPLVGPSAPHRKRYGRAQNAYGETKLSMAAGESILLRSAPVQVPPQAAHTSSHDWPAVLARYHCCGAAVEPVFSVNVNRLAYQKSPVLATPVLIKFGNVMVPVPAGGAVKPKSIKYGFNSAPV